MRAAEERMRQAEELMREAQERMARALDLARKAEHAENEVRRLAFEDQLTGLPNLNLVKQFLDFNLRQVLRYRRAAALLVVDLDRFRIINEALGFRAGDDLLVEVASRLKALVRGSDVLARRSEDEFVILLSELSQEQDGELSQEELIKAVTARAERVAQRVLDVLDAPFTVQGQPVYAGASIGISLCPGDAEDPQEMLEHADASLYCAKEGGRGRYHVYCEGLQERLRRRLTIDSDLHQAVEAGQLTLLYQPIVDLTDLTVVGVEALLRWNHPELGPVTPAEFLPVAEENGQMISLGSWVLDEGCRQLRAWKAAGLELFLNLNLSRRELLHAHMAENFLAALKQQEIEPRDVVVDISQDHYINDPRVRTVLVELGRGGVKVAVDNFGSGLYSLKAIRSSQTRILKLDASFVAGIPENRPYLSICVAVVRLADSMNMRSLAKGIENERQFNFLAKNECHLGQGYFFSQPLSGEGVTELVRAGRLRLKA